MRSLWEGPTLGCNRGTTSLFFFSLQCDICFIAMAYMTARHGIDRPSVAVLRRTVSVLTPVASSPNTDITREVR